MSASRNDKPNNCKYDDLRDAMDHAYTAQDQGFKTAVTRNTHEGTYEVHVDTSSSSSRTNR